MHPALRLQGWQVSDAAGGCFESDDSFRFFKDCGDLGTVGWTQIWDGQLGSACSDCVFRQ